MSADRVTYVDSSAIVRLVVREPESDALRVYLRRRRPLVASALARAEVMRAVLPLGAKALSQADRALATIELVRINDRVLANAGALEPRDLRTLAAIHLATALLLDDSLRTVVTYDARLSQAAGSLGLAVAAPG